MALEEIPFPQTSPDPDGDPIGDGADEIKKIYDQMSERLAKWFIWNQTDPSKDGRPKYAEVVTAITADGGTKDIDLSLGTMFYVTLSADTTLTFSNAPTDSSKKGFAFTIIVEIEGDTEPEITWPAEVIWPQDNIEPAMSTIDDDITIYVFLTADDAITWLGNMGGTRW